ncbi:hypothetical protein [Frankia sp. CcWB3]
MARASRALLRAARLVIRGRFDGRVRCHHAAPAAGIAARGVRLT